MEETQLTEGAELSTTFEEIEASEIKIMTAITRDPNPIHFDRKVIERMGFPGLVNQGASNLSYFVQGVAAFAQSSEQITSVDVRFKDKVYEGDTLTTEAVIESVRSEGGTRYIEVSANVEKDDETVAITGTATIERPID